MRLFLATCCGAAAVLTAAAAAAQPSPPPAPVTIESRHGWSATAGYESFTLRDISRGGRPPDASPIAWRGEGPVVTGRYEITRRISAHLFDGAWVQARAFTYEAPTRSIEAPDDLASRLDARYEYRRYFWRDLGLAGFDVGFGAQGLAARHVMTRHIAASLSTTSTIAGGGAAGVIAARFHRWDALHVDASWANGAILSRRTATHSAVPEPETFAGGNFLSDTVVRAGVRLTRETRLSVSWRRYFEHYGSDHYSYSGVWQSLNVGVLYAR